MSSTSRMICVRGCRCPSGGAFPGQRHIEAFGRVEPLRPLEGVVTVFDGSLQALACGIERHARLAVAHLPQRELQLALPPEEADAHLVELVERVDAASIALRASFSSAWASIRRLYHRPS